MNGDSAGGPLVTAGVLRRKTRLGRLNAILLLGLTAAAVAMLVIPANAGSARLVWNMTPSAPPGLYIIKHDGWRAGDRVAILPPEELAADLDRRGVLPRGKLLIKRVVAGAGDTVCRDSEQVSVNSRIVANARVADAGNALLPSWQGCVELTGTQVFLLGDTANSYDGRYFGVTSAGDVIGRAVLLVAFPLD
jgi:type IV secretory pathway protease TraF